MADKRVAGPDAPTLKEKGYPLEFSVWRGIGMPKGAPKEAIAAWSAAARKLAADPAFQATIAKQSLTLAVADTRRVHGGDCAAERSVQDPGSKAGHQAIE